MRIRHFVLLLIVILMPVASAANPSISNMLPINNEVNVSLEDGRVYLSADITDDDGDLEYILFETNKSGSWTEITDIYVSENWSSNVVFSGLDYGSSYWWRIKAKDSSGNWTNTSALKFKTEVKTGGMITVIPSEPHANRNVIILIDDVDEASGYLLCHMTSNVYLIEIKDGIGIVELGMEYGEALVKIIDYGTKSINIASLYDEELFIDAPSTVDLDDTVSVSVLAQGEMLSAKLTVKTSSGDETDKTTSANKPLDILFDEPGNWTLTAEIYDTTVSKTVFVKPEPIEIDLPSSSNMVVDNDMEIEINTQAIVVIEKDDATWTYETDEDGYVYFTPPWAGKYKLTVTTLAETKTEYFDIKSESTIYVKDINGNPVSSIGQGDTIFIQVSGESTGGSIGVYVDEAMWKQIELIGSSAVWNVDKQGSIYRLDFYPSNNALQLPATTTVAGMQNNVNALYLYIAAVVIVGFIVFLYISYKMGWNWKDLLFKKKGDEEDALL